jgi:hypothetical protein
MWMNGTGRNRVIERHESHPDHVEGRGGEKPSRGGDCHARISSLLAMTLEEEE